MAQPILPVISQPTLERSFMFLEKLEIDLDENPLAFGPSRLNQKVATARQMLTAMEKLYNRVSQWLQKYKATHRTAETSLGLAKQHLFASDPETRAGRNQTTQDAIASVKLADEVKEVARLGSVIEDLGALMVVLKAKRSDLRDVQARIRDQMKLCQEEIGLGSHWGSKVPPGASSPELSEKTAKGKTTLKELRELFEGVRVSGESLVEAANEEAPEEEPEPDPQQTADEARIEAILEESVQEGPDLNADDVIPPPPVSVYEGERNQSEEGSLSSYPQVGFCEECGEPQYQSPSGEVCKNGHGGVGTVDHPDDALNAPGRNDVEEPPEVEEAPVLEGSGAESDQAADALMSKITQPKVAREKIDIDDILADFLA